MSDDSDGYLDAFGVEVQHKGVTYAAIFDDDYQQAEFGRLRISSNAPELLISKRDVRRMGLALEDTLRIFVKEDDADEGKWIDYTVKSKHPRADEFTQVKCIESA